MALDLDWEKEGEVLCVLVLTIVWRRLEILKPCRWDAVDHMADSADIWEL